MYIISNKFYFYTRQIYFFASLQAILSIGCALFLIWYGANEFWFLHFWIGVCRQWIGGSVGAYLILILILVPLLPWFVKWEFVKWMSSFWCWFIRRLIPMTRRETERLRNELLSVNDAFYLRNLESS